MKKLIYLALLAASLTAISATTHSQEPKPVIPKWHSEKGYWVLESNINEPLTHTVRFYTNENILVYKEEISGVRLDPSRRKIKMKLKNVLETAIEAWSLKKVAMENRDYVAAVLK
jgi:hypothetical protein